jgi:hypothetical protein
LKRWNWCAIAQARSGKALDRAAPPQAGDRELLEQALTVDELAAIQRALSPDHDGSDFEPECPACTAFRKIVARLGEGEKT